MWKITLGVALGIVLAGIITTFGYMFFTGAAIAGFTEAVKQSFQSDQVRQVNNNPNRIVPISHKLPVSQQSLPLLPPPIIIKSKDEVIRENSEKAYMQVKKDVDAFKAQYEKPEECYNMKDSATRMRCANAYIKAREAYEASSR